MLSTSMTTLLIAVSFMRAGAQSLQATPPPPQNPAIAVPTSSTASNTQAPVILSAGRKLAYEFEVTTAKGWIDTGIDVVAGDRVTIDASGLFRSPTGGSFGPEGLRRNWNDLLEALPVRNAGRSALIGRIGGEDLDVPFVVGSHKELEASRTARLFLGINDVAGGNITGNMHIALHIVPATSTATTKVDCNFPVELLAQVPRRITDDGGRPGDMVNFILVGNEDAVLRNFADAGWVQVDRTKALGVMHAVLGTLAKQSYVEMPMSELYAYGRPQDYGFAHAEPVSVVMTRHHLRIWRAPFEFNSSPVWVGAATHDIGLEKDQRNGGVTHKIDPKVDDERAYVEETLNHTGKVIAQTYLSPTDGVKEARTATGGSFSSDGRILVLILR